MTEPEQASSVGQTAGLPGSNAHEATAVTPDDQTADTVSMGGVATPDSESNDDAG